VTAEKIAAKTIEAGQIATEAITAAQIKKETITEPKLATSLKKLIPLAVGRSGEMSLGKITIASATVTAAGPIIVSAEGTAVGVAVTARKVGESFTVESTTPSSARVDWAVYSE
jgi:hypothetical protein